jgi:ATP-dependent DNA helicase RecG
MFVFMGKVGNYNGQKTMNQPKIFSPEAYDKKVDTLEPVYSQVKGLSNASIMKAVGQAIEAAEYKEDFVPAAIRYNRQLMEMKEALAHVHFPENIDDFEKARGRLAYNELFLFSLALVKKKQNTDNLKSDFKLSPDKHVDEFINNLPFSLTKGQSEAIEIIRKDLSSGMIMNRLLQGDVGSGKTIVSFVACLETALNGYQAAIMAPTEILAGQHYDKMKKLLEENKLKLKAVLVTGSLKAKERREIYG